MVPSSAGATPHPTRRLSFKPNTVTLKSLVQNLNGKSTSIYGDVPQAGAVEVTLLGYSFELDSDTFGANVFYPSCLQETRTYRGETTYCNKKVNASDEDGNGPFTCFAGHRNEEHSYSYKMNARFKDAGTDDGIEYDCLVWACATIFGYDSTELCVLPNEEMKALLESSIGKTYIFFARVMKSSSDKPTIYLQASNVSH